jgi:hypothetical protein
MTRNRDIERVLDRFYAEGPSEVPDRLVIGVIDRIERLPQRRLATQMTRFATMNSTIRLAAAAAIVVAVAGIGAFAMSQRDNVGPPASPSPGPSSGSSPTFQAAAVPRPLQGRWVGAPRVVPEAPEPPIRNALIISDVQLGFALVGQGTSKQFPSTAALTAPGQLRLRGASTDGGCKPRDEGTYSFSLDASGTALTLTPIADACGPRAAALAGDWAHVGCTDDQGWCLGVLAPGTHHSTIFDPFVPESAWTFRWGVLAYSAPAGWMNDEDCAWCYRLSQLGAPENTNINVWSEAVPHVQADQCTQAPEPGVGRTADAIVTWLASLPGLVTSTPTPVTIGGLSGEQIDLSVAPAWTASCDYASTPGLPLVSTFSAPTAGDGFDWNIQGEGHTRIIALDLGDGRAVVINIEAQNQADYDALLPGAMDVVNSFMFER